MINMKMIAAAALLTSAIATPVLAQDVSQPTRMKHHTYSSQARDANAYDRQDTRRDSGFWPADVAAGVVDGVVGAAGAIASAPFRDDSYAYNNGYDNRGFGDSYANGYGYDSSSYAARNGFVCQPGTLFRGEDGRRHICQ